jgi:hypothetical protein
VTAGEFVALLATERLPVTLPAEAGAKVTLKLVSCPAERLKGRDGPETLKPEPLTVACETVTLPVPVLLTTTGRALLLPIATLPKLRLVGLADRSWVELTPVPVSETLRSEFEALLSTETLAEKLFAFAGSKVTLKLVLAPAASVRGKAGRLKLKAVPVTLMPEMVTEAFPVSSTVTVWGSLLSTVTLPKLTEEGFAASLPLVAAVAAKKAPVCRKMATSKSACSLAPDRKRKRNISRCLSGLSAEIIKSLRDLGVEDFSIWLMFGFWFLFMSSPCLLEFTDRSCCVHGFALDSSEISGR